MFACRFKCECWAEFAVQIVQQIVEALPLDGFRATEIGRLFFPSTLANERVEQARTGCRIERDQVRNFRIGWQYQHRGNAAEMDENAVFGTAFREEIIGGGRDRPAAATDGGIAGREATPDGDAGLLGNEFGQGIERNRRRKVQPDEQHGAQIDAVLFDEMPSCGRHRIAEFARRDGQAAPEFFANHRQKRCAGVLLDSGRGGQPQPTDVNEGGIDTFTARADRQPDQPAYGGHGEPSTPP